MARKMRTHDLSEPLDGASSARFDIHTGTGNLTIDGLAGNTELLASGTVEYMDGQDPPTPLVNVCDGKASFVLKGQGGRQLALRLPWSSCNAETNWQIHLNPAVSSDITVHSGGGNVKLDLSGMVVTGVSADTGGGNVEVVLPNGAANLNVCVRTGGGKVSVELGSGITGINILEARSGAGNVSVGVPDGIAARIHAKSGMGKILVDPQFSKTDGNTFQSTDYDNAADKIDITLHSGAGNISAITK